MIRNYQLYQGRLSYSADFKTAPVTTLGEVTGGRWCGYCPSCARAARKGASDT